MIYGTLVIYDGTSASGKPPGFGSGIHRFESCRPSKGYIRKSNIYYHDLNVTKMIQDSKGLARRPGGRKKRHGWRCQRQTPAWNEQTGCLRMEGESCRPNKGYSHEEYPVMINNVQESCI